MSQFRLPILVLGIVVNGCQLAAAAEHESTNLAETEYLVFQLMTGLPGYAGPQPPRGRFSLSKPQLDQFVRGEKLIETAARGFSTRGLQSKMRRLQEHLPAWIQDSGRQAQVAPLIPKLEKLIKERKWREADKMADEILHLVQPDE